MLQTAKLKMANKEEFGEILHQSADDYGSLTDQLSVIF